MKLTAIEQLVMINEIKAQTRREVSGYLDDKKFRTGRWTYRIDQHLNRMVVVITLVQVNGEGNTITIEYPLKKETATTSQ